MISVRKRLLFSVLVALLFAAGCSGSAETALSAGDRSISWEGLDDLVLGVNGILPGSESAPHSYSADSYRGVGEVWIQNALQVRYLADIGIEFTDDDRNAARAEIENAISGGALAAIPQSSEAYDALLLNLWLARQDLGDILLAPEAVAAVTDGFRSAHVGSRLGVFDPTSGGIVAHSLAGQ